MRRSFLLLAIGAFVLAPVGSAQAAVAYMDENGVPTAQGEPGEANDMTARAGGDGVIFTDSAGIRPRDEFGCRSLSGTEVTCAGDGGGLLLGEDGHDTLRDAGLAGGGFGARGGLGDDVIAAGAVAAIIYGDERTVSSADGNDQITGSSSTAVDPSQPGDFADSLNGGGGNDTIEAGDGPDHASGQAGTDTISGDNGDDVLDSTTLLTDSGSDAPGDEGNDTLNGGAGNDQLRADAGRDKVNGGDGDDFVIAVNLDLGQDDLSADTVDCGGGADRVAGGGGDKLKVGCEKLLVNTYCNGGYPCKVSGYVNGKAQKAKSNFDLTKIATVSKTMTGPGTIEFALGKKATKLLGTRKKMTLYSSWTAKRGKKFVGGGGSGFVFTK